MDPGRFDHLQTSLSSLLPVQDAGFAAVVVVCCFSFVLSIMLIEIATLSCSRQASFVAAATSPLRLLAALFVVVFAPHGATCRGTVV
jgi:hypothetical protein